MEIFQICMAPFFLRHMHSYTHTDLVRFQISSAAMKPNSSDAYTVLFSWSCRRKNTI